MFIDDFSRALVVFFWQSVVCNTNYVLSRGLTFEGGIGTSLNPQSVLGRYTTRPGRVSFFWQIDTQAVAPLNSSTEVGRSLVVVHLCPHSDEVPENTFIRGVQPLGRCSWRECPQKGLDPHLEVGIQRTVYTHYDF